MGTYLLDSMGQGMQPEARPQVQPHDRLFRLSSLYIFAKSIRR